MIVLIKIIYESVLQAFQQMRANKLRTALSLLGIVIGIFCIIAVLSAFDSLERNLKKSFEQLGDDVLYITKIPWADHSRESMWEYLRRPPLDYDDFNALQTRLENARYTALSVFLGTKTVKYGSSNINGAILVGATYDYGNILNMQLEKGRYFSPFEYHSASNRVVIGHEVANSLFVNEDPIGKSIKLMGRKMQVIGVVEKSGDELINPVNFDWALVISYPTARKVANVDNNSPFGNNLMVKAEKGVELDKLKDEVVVTLRNARRLRPLEEDNFAINELSILTNLLNSFFGVLNKVGWMIGGFAILVGIFSVANIMFVSVKERTRLIGIKKAIGAKRYMILIEFLIETVTLCLIGGAIGLASVFVVMEILSYAINFDLFLSLGNILVGIVLSVVIGIVSGIIPAAIAAWMDPVDAMRK